jgi:hypothetical protein
MQLKPSGFPHMSFAMSVFSFELYTPCERCGISGPEICFRIVVEFSEFIANERTSRNALKGGRTDDVCAVPRSGPRRVLRPCVRWRAAEVEEPRDVAGRGGGARAPRWWVGEEWRWRVDFGVAGAREKQHTFPLSLFPRPLSFSAPPRPPSAMALDFKKVLQKPLVAVSGPRRARAPHRGMSWNVSGALFDTSQQRAHLSPPPSRSPRT